ncbi:hypothetical protein Elgi_38000 [Paenibacillus elgii]|uniref:hypothetical protein n=1 Tax=Paenibacillus elgii TaxID=189691 RepID=UPI002D7D503A|nr:hypothetical protein Elgi_38000 [Paenibacillus elgii]
MSIYNNPKKYADYVGISLEEAEKICTKQLKLQEEINIARTCLKCSKQTLEYEGYSYEEQIQAYIYCSNDEVLKADDDGEEYFKDCGFYDQDVDDMKYDPLTAGYDFDELLYKAIMKENSYEI